MRVCKRLPTVMAAALAVVLGGCGKLADDLVCGDDDCQFSSGEWSRIRALTGLGEPPPDPSNRYLPKSAYGDPADPNELAVVKLGQRYYFESRFSGNATWKDVLGRDTPLARAPRGEAIKIACATCHDPTRAGSDFTSPAGNVSVGAGMYDVNGQQTANAAQYPLLYWNGRSDSLWSQAAAVMESGVSMNGTRLAILWVVADNYRADHEALFTEAPLPMTGKSADVKALLAKDMAGNTLATCTGTADACPEGCRAVHNDAANTDVCVPRFPLAGKKGAKDGCQLGDASEPAGDAYDCMDPMDRAKVDRAYSHVAKAIAAYEWKLTSRDSVFDRFVADPKTASAALPPAALRGLKLFVGRASCIDCHSGPLLSDGKFHNIGVPQQGVTVPTEGDCPKGNARCDCTNVVVNPMDNTATTTCMPWGLSFGLSALHRGTAFRRDGPYSDNPEPAKVTYAAYYNASSEDLTRYAGTWRTPSLRDVATTAPYMHNGFYKTLEDVIWHYDEGGSIAASGVKAAELRPLYLSSRDRTDLVEFLRTLTGAPIRTDFVTAAQP
ncbi:MAG TPA: cytochrome c peroxidase [Polyangia bacterium]|nr:cytochrome c peroxidase [Polyangia bacterium]